MQVLGEPDSVRGTPRPLLDVLQGQPEPLLAILDAARDQRVLELLRNSGEKYESLYEGKQAEDLANFAPYLVEFTKSSRLLPTLLEAGWGKSWGVYLTSSKTFVEVRKHFRHFLIVEKEDGKHVYFRFYDPRVLREFLPAFNKSEAREFVGPVDCFLVEGTRTDLLLRFGMDSERVCQEEIKLTS
jgi:hypothetical protein